MRKSLRSNWPDRRGGKNPICLARNVAVNFAGEDHAKSGESAAPIVRVSEYEFIYQQDSANSGPGEKPAYALRPKLMRHKKTPH
jgi:hypothetical protein